MNGYLARYLRKRGYHVHRALAKPEIGDEIEFMVGGNWQGEDSYIQTGIVTAMDDKHPETPFKKYGYIRAVKRDATRLIADHVIHPKEVIRILNSNKEKSE